MQFEKINLNLHKKIVLQNRKDSFQVSFGDTADFDADQVYLDWLAEKIRLFPKGFVLVKEDGKDIGQLELTVREYQGKEIGYVNLYYLVPNKRGGGRGADLHQYAKQFFKKHQVNEFHLRVAPSNSSAIKFYQKIGMEKIGDELGGKVLRMRGEV
ncbi:GNAT family N-acetyltransferase [Amphibacillus sp. Q70]|uniref:GNAT family N-acetyltransferase n=1 Tax=Amphibacillus sp. Q70 TaxID=3453416 RepID=UPI003F83B768